MNGNVLIIGATSDMAVAVAKLFASEGYAIMLSARSSDELGPVASDLRIKYPFVEVDALALDVTDFASHEGFYGGLPRRPEVVITFAGMMGDLEGALKYPDQLRRVTDTNYTGCASLLGLAALEMEARGGGSIIGVTSVAGDRGRKSNFVYGSAKAALTAYLSGMRQRLSRSGVHVMTVKPGFVSTRMTEGMGLPPALTATPEEVARDIYRAWRKKKDVVYTKWFWRYIMLIIRHIPEGVFKKTNI